MYNFASSKVQKTIDKIVNIIINPLTKEVIMTTANVNAKCHAIIHSAAVASGVGNAVPVPGTGWAADTIALTGMAISLASVFGKDLTKSAASAMAVAALKKQFLKQPLKYIGKELGKLVPWGGQAAAAVVSAGLVEAAGWSMVKQFETGNIIC